jgi:hypothetical protein
MSKKLDQEMEQEAALPFFAHLLSDQTPAIETTSCLSDACTKKYPSDGDDSSPTYDKIVW